MPIDEVFVNPTVKQVIFQMLFPNLFYIENKIGEFQLKIMNEFPESKLLHRMQFTWADVGPDSKLTDIESKLDKDTTGQKIWQFNSPKNFQINVTSNSLDISSMYHKTYRMDNGDKFRDVIELAVKNFFQVVSVPLIGRVGLRYVDECPIFSKDNDTFKSYYNSVFPIQRFNLADVEEMDFKGVIKRGDCVLRYVESLKKVEDQYLLILDFDSVRNNVNPEDVLKVTDDLHTIISEEYEKTITERVKEYMRKPKAV
ncbi:MAG: TIGR04255 family protein [Dehalococcoidales bacterium]